MNKRNSKRAVPPKRKQAEALAIFKRANSAWERGQDRRAFTEFLKAARLGDPSAQHNLGYFYDEGIGTKRNFGRALLWYLKAWRAHGQTDTCINIAQLYAARRKVRNAVLWWNKAIRLGDGDAALDLAKFYLARESKADKKRARALLRKVLAARHVTEDALDAATELLDTNWRAG
jgi:TPR repeat protein